MKKIIFTIVFAFAIPALSQYPATVLISDIDDTLKISNVNDGYSGIPSAVYTDRRFTGMQEIYRELEKNNLFFHFYYVSAAPLLLMQKHHEKFLTQHDFPMGQLILRLSGPTVSFKVSKITEIIKRHNADTVILVGDNAQEDSEIFHQVQMQFPQVKFHHFVHVVTDPQRSTVRPSQTGYAYAAELAYHLAMANFLPMPIAESLMKFINDKLPLETNSPEKSFPDWLDCRGHQFTHSGTPLLATVSQNVVQYCH